MPDHHVPRCHLIVFARFPRDGQCKTRLIPALGPAGAAAVHRELVTFTARWSAAWQSQSANGDRQATVAFTGGSTTDMQSLCGAGLRIIEQSAGDLGDRLNFALQQSRESGWDHSVVIGTDCPALGPAQIDRAHLWLQSHDIVLGPASDGGYYLLGVNHRRVADEAQQRLFVGIEWGSAQVLQQTLSAARSQGLRIALLETLDDIDRPEDLQPWWANSEPMESLKTVSESSSKIPTLLQLPPTRTPSVTLSIVIPVLQHEPMLALAIASARKVEVPGVELLVVGAEVTDETLATAIAHRVPMISSERGRGRQLNAGAQATLGEVLLFLHADSQLPQDYLSQIEQTLARPRTGGGAFQLAIAASGWGYRLVEWGANLRSRWWGVPYGDQAIFVGRDCFTELGGFREWPVMEDYDFAYRLRRMSGLRIAPARVTTSSRRWQRLGIWRTWLRNQRIILAYRLGYPVEQLGNWY